MRVRIPPSETQNAKPFSSSGVRKNARADENFGRLHEALRQAEFEKAADIQAVAEADAHVQSAQPPTTICDPHARSPSGDGSGSGGSHSLHHAQHAHSSRGFLVLRPNPILLCDPSVSFLASQRVYQLHGAPLLWSNAVDCRRGRSITVGVRIIVMRTISTDQTTTRVDVA